MNTLIVKGMHCKSCEVILTEDISAIAGVTKVLVNHKTGVVNFEGSASTVSLAKKAIEANGYSVT